MKPRRQPESDIKPETSYLISDIEELVNDRVGNLLKDEPFIVKVYGYFPEMQKDQKDKMQLPIGINRIANTLSAQGADVTEFTGISLDFVFPLSPAVDNPLNVTLRWSDGTECVLALTGIGPIMYACSRDGSPLFSARLENHEVRSYFETLGLPSSMWKKKISTLVSDLSTSDELSMERSVTHVIDGSTAIDVRFFALHKSTEDDKKEVIQDLSFNINHFVIDQRRPTYRSALRFARNVKESAWVYRGLYSGKLTEGELIDELIQADPELGVPSNHLLDKALGFLNDLKPARL